VLKKGLRKMRSSIPLISNPSRKQNGTIKLYKELRCPLDDFELLLFSLGKCRGWERERGG
jgi:hypothetical protein